MFGRSGSNDRPMFPPTQTLNLDDSIRPSSDTVVLLPLVPVTPKIGAGHRSVNRQISLVMGTPAAAAAERQSSFGGTAGEATTRDARVNPLARHEEIAYDFLSSGGKRSRPFITLGDL